MLKELSFKSDEQILGFVSPSSIQDLCSAVEISDRALLIKKVDRGAIVLIARLWLSTGKTRLCLLSLLWLLLLLLLPLHDALNNFLQALRSQGCGLSRCWWM
ncbi:MAG: hypothetical protein ACRCVL_05680, partial [Cetobacterium sp.]